MMLRVYLRIGKSSRGVTIDASTKPNGGRIMVGYGRGRRGVPTVAFGVDLDIPDRLFEASVPVVARLELPEELVSIGARAVPTGKGIARVAERTDAPAGRTQPEDQRDERRGEDDEREREGAPPEGAAVE